MYQSARLDVGQFRSNENSRSSGATAFDGVYVFPLSDKLIVSVRLIDREHGHLDEDPR